MFTTYLRITAGSVAPEVILVGDPARAHLAAELLDVTDQGKNREFTWLTGTARTTGKPVSVVACGIGAPAWGIAMTELEACGVQRLVRVGTALTPVLPLGTVALARSALRYDRISEDYLPLYVPALPDPSLHQALLAALRADGVPSAAALFARVSTLYRQMGPLFQPVGPGPRLDQSTFRESLALGAFAVDMETAVVLAFAQHFRLAAASACMCTVTGNGGPVLEKAQQQELERKLLAAVFAALG